MRTPAWVGRLPVLLLLIPTSSPAAFQQPIDLAEINRKLHGQVVDHTHNHGVDNRIWSQALCQRRDLYVYLPPGFNPARQYPIGLYFHGFTQDETHFLQYLVPLFDQAMAEGKLPASIIACPDGSIPGRPAFFNSASFYANSRAGRFEDFVMQDVWPFLLAHYPIRPERDSHVLIGASMGGAAAFRIGFFYPETFKTLIGIFPAVNMRWVDCHGHYQAPFDPQCWGWRTKVNPNEVVGRFYGIVAVRFRNLIAPLFGLGPDSLLELACRNPIELLDSCRVQVGQFNMYLSYGSCDQFNIGAQVESFAYRARERGLTVKVDCLPGGKHDVETGAKLFPLVIEWVAPLVAPFSPGCPASGSPGASVPGAPAQQRIP